MQGCRSGGPPSWRKRLPTTLSPQLRRTRARRAHPPHTSARLCGSPRPEDPRPRRLRTQQHAQHIEGHVRQPRLVEHGLRQDGYLVRAAVEKDRDGSGYPIPRSLARGVAAAPSDCASETEGSGPGRMGQAALRRRRAADQDLDSLQRPPHGDSGPAAAALSPPAPAPSAPARRGHTLSAARCPL